MTREIYDNQENKNNQKMNYIYSTKRVNELKQNIDELEKLEQEYLKRIEERKQGNESKRARVNSAIKTGSKNDKLNLNKDKPKKNIRRSQNKDFKSNNKENNIQTKKKDNNLNKKNKNEKKDMKNKVEKKNENK